MDSDAKFYLGAILAAAAVATAVAAGAFMSEAAKANACARVGGAMNEHGACIVPSAKP